MPSNAKQAKLTKSKKSLSQKTPGRSRRDGKFVHPPRQEKKRAPVVGIGTRAGGSATSEDSQLALLESEEKYRALFDQAREGIALIGLNTDQIIDCNLEFESQTGRKLNQLKKMKFRELMPPGKLHPAKKKLSEMKGKATGGFAELELQKPNGEIILVEFASRVIKIQNDRYVQVNVRYVTERKQSEERIRQQNEFLNNVIESLPNPLYVIDANDYTIKRANSAAGLGSLSESSTCYALTHGSLKPCDSTENPCPLEEVKKTKKPVFVEHIHHDEEGNIRTVEVHGYPILDKQRDVVQMITYSLDITERKRAEEALKQSEQKYKQFADSLPQVVFETDEKGNLTYVNRSALENYDYTKEDLDKGINVLELVIPEDRERFKKDLPRRFRGEKLASDEYIALNKDGSTFPIVVHSAPVIRENKVVGLRGIIVDIAERKRAEEALKSARDELEIRVKERTEELTEAIRELQAEVTERKRAEEQVRASEEKYKTLVETSRDMIFTVDLKGNFLFTNQAFEKSLGYSAEEIQKINGFDLVHPEDLEKVREQFAALVEGKRVDNMEYRYRAKDGFYINILNNASPIFDSGDNVVAAFGVARNITERKRGEEELRRYRYHLEEMVEKRTAKLKETNQQLEMEITDRKQAEEALEWELAVNMALAELSGALITPSSSIDDIADIVLDSAKSLTQSEHGYVSSIDPKTRDHVAHTLTKMMGKECLVRGEDRRIRFPIGSDGCYPGLWGHAMNSRQAFYTNSPDTHEASRGIPEGHIAIKNFLSVPAIIGEELVGQIALANSAKDYTDRDLEAIKRLAELHAVAIERKRAEEALKAEKEFTERALNAQTDTFFVFEPSTGRAIRWNRTFNKMSGYSDEEIRSMKAPDSYYNEEDLKKAAAATEKIIHEGIATVELSLITKDGRSIPTEYTGSAVMDNEGDPKYIIAVGRDITERKRAEEELQKRTYELGERVKELNCLYGIADLMQKPGILLQEILKGTVNLIPPAWQYPKNTCARVVLEGQIFRTSNFRETIWRQASDIIVHDDRVGTLEVYYLEEKPERDEGPFSMEERSLINAIAERLGRIMERKKAEEAIQKLNKTLKSQAIELAAANKELEAFSYSVSHDLRAPLRTVDGFSRALVEDYPDKLDETGKDYIRRVRAATQHMEELIDDLLNLSLVMRTQMHREETNLSELVRTIAAELQKAQPERQVEFIIHEEVLAHGDPRLLRDVLENLLGNAWKFTGKHSHAKIEFGVTQKEGQTIYFVRDDGAGFDIAYKDKLFVPFQRLHSAAEFSGNGIGLAVASRIINRHGGRIWAEGKVEKGAAFYFTLQQ